MIYRSWNQVSMKETTAQILPNLDAMHEDIRRLATNLNVKLQALQQTFENSSQQIQVRGIANLKDFAQSAATVLSCASTISRGDVETDSVFDINSELGDFDWYQSGASTATLSWIYSQTGDCFLFESGERGSIQIDQAGNGTSTSTGMESQASASLASTLGFSAAEVERRNPVVERPTLIAPDSLPNPVVPIARSGPPEDSKLVSVSGVTENSSPARPVLQDQPNGTGDNVSKQAVVASPRSSHRRNIGSLVRFFSVSRGTGKKPASNKRTEPKPSKYRDNYGWAEVRKKFVFVGDGACGKTCFLM